VAFGMVGPHVFATGQTLAGPRAAGKWMGLQNCASNFAGILGPIATGVILDGAGGFQAAFLMTAALTLVGVVGWGLMIRKIEPLDWT
jgi:ACS family D-galactonate transporter-like MFS transporter